MALVQNQPSCHWKLQICNHQCYWCVLEASVLYVLWMRDVSEKRCEENWTTHFIFNNFFFFRKSFRLWDNVEKYGKARHTIDDNTMRRRKDVICMPDNWNKNTDTLPECVTFITFKLLQWLRERASVLFYTYIASLVFINLLHVTQAQARVTLLCTYFCKQVCLLTCVWHRDITQNCSFWTFRLLTGLGMHTLKNNSLQPYKNFLQDL